MASFKLLTASQVSKQLSMDDAVRAVKEGGIIMYAAAKQHGICRETLRHRILGRHSVICDEAIPLHRNHCIGSFSHVAMELGLTNTKFDDKYLRRFLKRHAELSIRVTHASNRKKAREWTTERCEEYIAKLQKLHDEGYFERAEQVWNLDETAFDTAEMYDRVIARKVARQIPSPYDGTEKECVTILPSGNAAGIQLKFMALYAGKVHVRSRLDDTEGMCYHAVNSSGYMDEIHFANYMKQVVLPALTEDKNIIFVDGHFSHINNVTLSYYCKELTQDTGKKVAIFCLPAGQTSHLQHWDASAFGGVKKKYKMYFRDRRLTPNGMVTKDNLLSHVVKLWYRLEGCPEKYAFNIGDCLKSGFQKCGLYPFSPNVIRSTVKSYNDPTVSNSGKSTQEISQDFTALFEVLRSQHHISSESDLQDFKEFTLLKQRGITPEVVLASALQKTLMGAAPTKQRRAKDEHLSTESGALVNEATWEEHRDKAKADKAKVTAKKTAKRKAPEPGDISVDPRKKRRKAAVRKTAANSAPQKGPSPNGRATRRDHRAKERERQPSTDKLDYITAYNQGATAKNSTTFDGNLLYTDAALHDIQRLSILAPLSLPHRTFGHMQIDGYDIPAGTCLYQNRYAMSRDTKYWARPNDFHPEHFLGPSGELVMSAAYSVVQRW
ncbi:hypothetical protein RvY_04030 [Ramazzottius varieornatus]|uniref:DDE-1 domain-containing protein n=1 Tax=Ramazzottius varieornatus TaxID=947166 RepID=A0A1D1UQX1_RAMVA|nr:hypothetical protein RvY_04030 [Ramazzottius varieornatus]